MAASEATLRALWAALVVELHERITNPSRCEHCGKSHVRSALLRVAGQFLKDQGINANTIQTGLEQLLPLVRKISTEGDGKPDA